MIQEATKLQPFGQIPTVFTIDRFAQENSFLESLLAPIMMSTAIGQQIREMSKEAFNDIDGLKIFYNLFSMLNMVDEYRKTNLRWDEQDEKGLVSTKIMLEHLRKNLVSELKIEIPLHSVFINHKIE